MFIYHSNQRFVKILYGRPETWALYIISPDYGWVMKYTKEKLNVALYGLNIKGGQYISYCWSEKIKVFKEVNSI